MIKLDCIPETLPKDWRLLNDTDALGCVMAIEKLHALGELLRALPTGVEVSALPAEPPDPMTMRTIGLMIMHLADEAHTHLTGEG